MGIPTGSKRESLKKTILLEFVTHVVDAFTRKPAVKASLSALAVDGNVQTGDYNVTATKPLVLDAIGAHLTLSSWQAFTVTIKNNDVETTFRCGGTLILFGSLQSVTVSAEADENIRIHYVVS